MSDEMKVEPSALAEASRSIDQAGVAVDRLVQSLSSTVISGSPWGGDEAGTVFGAAYGELLGQALGALDSHVEQLGQARDGLLIWASSVVETDHSGATSYQSIQTALGGG